MKVYWHSVVRPINVIYLLSNVYKFIECAQTQQKLTVIITDTLQQAKEDGWKYSP